MEETFLHGQTYQEDLKANPIALRRTAFLLGMRDQLLIEQNSLIS
jgi:hypothetical protein